MNIAINGFGRIGKNFLRRILQEEKFYDKLKIIAINIGLKDQSYIDALAHSFKYDTLMGTYPNRIYIENNNLIIQVKNNNITIPIIAKKEPKEINWSHYNIDWVVDASGKYTHRDMAQQHLDAGAKAVLITAPAKHEDITIVLGVNFDKFDKSKHKIVSLASCTTNALVPLLHVLEENFGLELAHMTTVHAYTNSQVLLDVDSSTHDLRHNRAAAVNIIPTTTGAMEVVDKIIPEIKGRITGVSLRVPVVTVSLVDLAFTLKQKINIKDLHEKFEQAEKTYLKNIMQVSNIPLVSCDYAGNPSSVIFDTLMTQVLDNTGKIFGWYDNEWGYSCRLVDFLMLAN